MCWLSSDSPQAGKNTSITMDRTELSIRRSMTAVTAPDIARRSDLHEYLRSFKAHHIPS